MFEASGNVPDNLIGDAARRHPRRHHLLIGIGLGLLGPGIGGQDEIRSLAAGLQLHEQRLGGTD